MGSDLRDHHHELLVSAIHDRMPVIIAPKDYTRRLSTLTNPRRKSVGDVKPCLMLLPSSWQSCGRRFNEISAVVASSDEFTRHQINACRSVVQNRRICADDLVKGAFRTIF